MSNCIDLKIINIFAPELIATVTWLGLSRILLLHILHCFLQGFSKETDFVVRTEPRMPNPIQCILRDRQHNSVELESCCIRYAGYRKYVGHLSPRDGVVKLTPCGLWITRGNSRCVVTCGMWKLRKRM